MQVLLVLVANACSPQPPPASADGPLPHDPLADIRNTRAIAAVVLGGRLIARPELDRMLADLDALYAPMRAMFSPRAAAALGSGGG